MGRLLHWLRTSAWKVLLVMVLFAPITVSVEYVSLAGRIERNAKKSYIDQCNNANEVRREIVGFVDSTLERSRRSTQATLSAPQSTQEQILAATKNLAALTRVEHQTSVALAPHDCSYPPAPKE